MSKPEENSVDFEHLYEEPCSNCGEGLDWDWDVENVRFYTVCACFNEYTLTPRHGDIEEVDG